MTAIERAMELLGRDPLPDDAYEQMIAIEADVTEHEILAFSDLWEAFIVAGGKFPDETS